MLHIQMYKGEYMTIGEDIKIHCSKVGKGENITLSIEAPTDMKILRPKHVQDELAELALNGDREAQSVLRKLQAAKHERETKNAQRNLHFQSRRAG